MIGYQSKNKFVLNLPEEIKNTKQNPRYIPLAEAGEILGTSRDYLNVLVRRGKLRAVKLGRNWFTTSEWLSEYQSPASKLEQAEKAELAFLRDASLAERLERVESRFENIQNFRDREISKKVSTSVSSQEIQLPSRRLAPDEKTKILEAVKERIKTTDSNQFQNASKKLGIYKSLKSWSTAKLSLASGFTALAFIISFCIASGLISFSDFNNQALKYSRQAGQANIFSNVFKNFPNDIPQFSDWLAEGINKSFSIFSPSQTDLTIDELKSGKSKIAIEKESQSSIDTLAQAEALDSFAVEDVESSVSNIGGASGQTVSISGSNFSLLENRLSLVELSLQEQSEFLNSELSLQKKTILGTLETLFGIAKLVPTHPISTVVVQGQPATLTTYSVAPQVNSGFDRLSATYFSVANDATINGSLTVKSGGSFNTLSVSGNTSLSNLTVSTSLLPPRMTTAQKNSIVSPAAGLILFDTDLTKLNVYNGTVWKNVGNPEIGSDVPGGTSGSVLYVDSSGFLAQDNANFFWDASLHSLGIGTSTPNATAILDLTSTSTGLLPPRMTTAQKNSIVSPASGLMLFDTDLTKLNVYNGTVWKNVGNPEIGSDVTGGTSGSVLYVDSSGFLAQDNANFFWDESLHNLGIGTTTPTAKLSVQGDSYLYGNLTVTGSGGIDSNLTVTGQVFLADGTAAAPSLTFFNDVNLGLFKAGADILGFTTNGSEKMRIDASGNIGIGTTTTSYAQVNIGNNLAVLGTASSSFNGIVQFNGTPFGTNINQGTIYLNPISAGTNNVIFGVAVGGTEQVRIDAEGDVQIVGLFNSTNTSGTNDFFGHFNIRGNTTLGSDTSDTVTFAGRVNSDIVPSADMNYNLGTPSLRFNKIYAGEFVATSTTVGGTASSTFIINTGNLTNDTEDSSLQFSRGTVSPNAILKWDSVNQQFNLNLPLNLQGTLLGNGTASSSFAGPVWFTGASQGTATSSAVVYINPSSGPANFNLFDIAVNGVERMRVDAEGDTSIWGSLGVENGIYDLSQDTLTIDDNLQINGSGGIKDSGGISRITLGLTNAIIGNLTTSLNLGVATTTVTGNALTVQGNSYLYGDLVVTGNANLASASTTNFSVSGNLWTNGVLLLADGLSGTPSLSFSSDPDTGIFRVGDNKIGFSTGGTNRLTIDSTGRVAIGVMTVTDAQAMLDVGTSDTYNNTIVDEAIIRHNTTGTAGNGLGAGLAFWGQAENGTNQQLGRISGVVEQASTTVGFGSYLSFWTKSGTDLQEKMRLTSTGALALATTTIPLGYGVNIATSTYIYGNLTVSGNSLFTNANITNASSTYLTVSDTSWINLLNVTNTTGTSTITGGLTVGNNAALSVDRTAPANSLFIKANGNVGIGTASPGYKLDVAGTVKASTQIIASQGINGTPYLFVNPDTAGFSFLNSIGSAWFLKIDGTSGNVGIGTIVPGYKLDVNGIGSFADYARASYFTATSTSMYSTFPNASTTYLTVGSNIFLPNSVITNANLANSSLTVNGTAISLGGSGTVTAAAETLTGTALNSTVVSSSLTSLGTITNLVATNATTTAFNVNGTITSQTGVLNSNIADSATGVGFLLSTNNSLSTQGAKLLSLQNASSEKFYIDKDGNLYTAGTILSGNGTGILMINKSGGTVAKRSLVVIDTTTNSAFATTTTAYAKSSFGVITGVGLGVTYDANGDGICNAEDVCMVAVGGEVEVLLTNASTAVKGDYIYTSATAGSGVASAKQFDGLIGIVSNTAGSASGYGKMIFKVQPQVSGSQFLTKEDTALADGGYVEIVHNQSTNDVISNGWVYNTTTAKWEQIDNNTGPTGGTITYTDSDGLNASTTPYSDGYTVHTFTATGTSTLTFPSNFASSSIQVLVVAGGAGGGATGGGGGAGGYQYNASLAVTPQAYSVVVGGGGNGSTNVSVKGSNGSNSTFSTITATGGGGGGSNDIDTGNGANGGSGGGAASRGPAGSGGTGSQGYNGGNG
ncbi:MAG: helix-turn-helix domain-containing protein, partial [Patescibacteria group bacterium]